MSSTSPPSDWEVTDGSESDASSGVDVSARQSEGESETSTSPVIVPRMLSSAPLPSSVSPTNLPPVEQQSSLHIPQDMIHPIVYEHFVAEAPTIELESQMAAPAISTNPEVPTRDGLSDGSENVEDEEVESKEEDEQILLDIMEESPPLIVSPPRASSPAVPSPTESERLIAEPVVAQSPGPIVVAATPPALAASIRPAPPLLPPPPAVTRLAPSRPISTHSFEQVTESVPITSIAGPPLSSAKPSRYASRLKDLPPFHPDPMVPTLGLALLDPSDQSDAGEMERKISSSSGSSTSSKSSTSSSSSQVLAALNPFSHFPSPGKSMSVYEPDRCFCCRLSWLHRVIGFAIAISASAVLFILSFFSLGRVILDTPLAFTCLYGCAHATFILSTCFLVGPHKSAISLIHNKRKLLAFLYFGSLLLLVWMAFVTDLAWLLPVWFIHLASFSWWGLNHLPLSKSVLARAIALALKRNHNGATPESTCCNSNILPPEDHLVAITIGE